MDREVPEDSRSATAGHEEVTVSNTSTDDHGYSAQADASSTARGHTLSSLLKSGRFSSLLQKLMDDKEGLDKIKIKQETKGDSQSTRIQFAVKPPAPSTSQLKIAIAPKPAVTRQPATGRINIVEITPNRAATRSNAKDTANNIKIIPVPSTASPLKKAPQSLMRIKKEKKDTEGDRHDLVSMIFPNPDLIQSDLQNTLNLVHFLPVSPPASKLRGSDEEAHSKSGEPGTQLQTNKAQPGGKKKGKLVKKHTANRRTDATVKQEKSQEIRKAETVVNRNQQVKHPVKCEPDSEACKDTAGENESQEDGDLRPLITITGFSESVEATPDEILDHLEDAGSSENTATEKPTTSGSSAESPGLKTEVESNHISDGEDEPSDHEQTSNPRTETSSCSRTDAFDRQDALTNTNSKSGTSKTDLEIRKELIKTPAQATPEKSSVSMMKQQLCARSSVLRRIFAERGEGSSKREFLKTFSPRRYTLLMDTVKETKNDMDMRALDEKIKRMIDREIEEVETISPGGESRRAVRFRHRERERHRKRNRSLIIPRSASEKSDSRCGKDAEKDPSSQNDSFFEDAAQSKSHSSLPGNKQPENPRRSKSQPAIGTRIISKMKLEAKMAETYSQMLAVWSDYIHMDSVRMRQEEIKNAIEFDYSEESMAMIEDEELYVWQLVEDLVKPYSTCTL